MLRTLVRSLSLVAILAGTAAAADPLPTEAPAKAGNGGATKVEPTKVAKKKSVKKSKKKSARKNLKKKSKKSHKAAKAAAPAERRPSP